VNALPGGGSVGRYRIVSFLGAGAMGEVYLAEDPQIDRKLAIKTVRLVGRPQEIEERKKRLLREARAAGRLLHPNVVTLFDAGETEGLLYLAFELVEGTDLAARLDGGERLSLREVLRVVRQTAEALDYAHGQGIVHRDIKPSNILLDRAGRVKVADFGIAKMAGQSTELTMAGSVMGSPQYLSPEQIRGEDLDGRSDIFSLGVVLYEMLSGRRPFSGETITTLVYQILHQEPPPVSELRAVPPRLEELLRRMLAKDREERIATAGEIARELAAIEGELADETLSAPVGTGALGATKVLPRRTTDAAPLVPPLPPAARSTRGTVPASPATTPSMPPPPPPVSAPPATGVRAAAAAKPGRSPFSSTLLLVTLALVLAATLAGAGYLLFQRFRPAPPVATAAQTPAPAGVPAVPVEGSQTPADKAEPPPASVPASAPAGPPRTPAQTRKEAEQRTPDAVPVYDGTPTPLSPAVEENNRIIREALDRERSSEPAMPVSPEPVAEPEPAPAPAAQDADQTIRTGLEVVFRTAPPDAFVLVDGRVIGTAKEWSGGKGGKTYTFPGSGSYQVKIRSPGMQDFRIAVEAAATRGVTPITARLQPLPAAEVDASDLRTVRVRQAIALRVMPLTAGVLVDGQPMGLARRFSGGGLRRGRGEWLELAPGKHRVSIDAPGHRRQDILVEVTATADRDRERIEVVLARGGDG
jgi:serine/threonine-protein kinase